MPLWVLVDLRGGLDKGVCVYVQYPFYSILFRELFLV